jgi:putative Holliday junction resolvase
MKFLGIDYGRKKIGLATSEGMLAEPLKVIRFEKIEEALTKVEQVVRTESTEKVIIGISEGKMGEETREFARKLKEKISVEVVFQDETLSTQSAQELSLIANVKRKKRKEMEDAYSAAIILQNYIDGV